MQLGAAFLYPFILRGDLGVRPQIIAKDDMPLYRRIAGFIAMQVDYPVPAIGVVQDAVAPPCQPVFAAPAISGLLDCTAVLVKRHKAIHYAEQINCWLSAYARNRSRTDVMNGNDRSDRRSQLCRFLTCLLYPAWVMRGKANLTPLSHGYSVCPSSSTKSLPVMNSAASEHSSRIAPSRPSSPINRRLGNRFICFLPASVPNQSSLIAVRI